ncbi:unnamed protein product [Rotaria socialis]|uniref:TIR domain-containing protein n=1 Tax=Rotaria socialis TaxID=392032 RepID=A0A821GYU7_9BILA|nr:unnamed protein product [Rotaria socialis]CAF4673755.1 unnamed protein product [Rotaria socialis]
MDSLLIQHSSLVRRLRRENSNVTVAEIKLYFDNIVFYIKNFNFNNKKNDALDILTLISDDFAAMNTLQLFDHPALINHPIFIYIGRTLEMLLVKMNHSQSIPMAKYEEDCFYSISYLIAQLCLYRNETIKLFYGSISDEIFPVTDKINIRDESINENSRRSNPIAEKPNLKVTGLPPRAPIARPIEEKDDDITKIPHRKIFSAQLVPVTNVVEFQSEVSLIQSTDFPSKTYQEILLTNSLLNKLSRAIDDLSRIEYSPYHVKYKIIDRLVRLCSKMNIVDRLLDPIVKCLCSKLYRQAFITIESEQLRLNPKQLLFIYQCTQFIIQHEFQRQEQIPHLLCQAMIDVTKPIVENILPIAGEFDATYFNDRGIALYALSCHLELLNHLSLTSSGRRYFMQSNIIDQMKTILYDEALLDNAVENEELFHADVAVVVYTLMLLCNLAYEKQMFSILKKQNFQNIYSKLEPAKDSTIQLACQTLSIILSQDQINEENEPMKLRKMCAEYLEKNVIESKQKKKLGVVKDREERDTHVKLRFLNETFLANLKREIEHLATTEYDSNPSRYKNIGRNVRVVSLQETSEVESLLDPILQCLNSNFYLKVFGNIELSQSKPKYGAISNNRPLAAKHLFFMRECPEFLFRHDYKRRKETADTLGRIMLEHTKIIFEQHLSILLGDEGKQNVDEIKAARMTALSYHVKLLSHFSLIRSIRKQIVSLPIINQILSILEDQSLIDSRGRIDDAKIGIVAQSLILLYNLAVEDQVLEMLKTRNLMKICTKLRLVKDKIIHFMSQILMIMLDKKAYEDIYEPHSLSKTSVEYINRSIVGPRQVHQGIKLHHLLKNLEGKPEQFFNYSSTILDILVLTQNDTFSECLVEEKEGISVMTKCVCVDKLQDKNPDRKKVVERIVEDKSSDDDRKQILERIQKLAVLIIWKLSFYGPKTITKLKSNDLFIDQILLLLSVASEKSIKTPKSIIWRLGNEETIRSEIAKKDKTQRKTDEDTTDPDQLISTDEWDESIPYDVIISYSNKTQDKILTVKIYNRLTATGYRVYSEKQGNHRLQLMKKAVEKRKPILVCLSSAYRKSKICMAELEYAFKESNPVIPVIVEPNYKIQGWLKHIINGKNPIDLANLKIKEFDDQLIRVSKEIEEAKIDD